MTNITNLYFKFFNKFYYEVNPETGLTTGTKGLTQANLDFYRKMSNIKVNIIT